MKFKISAILSLLASIHTASSFASTIICEGCTSAAMIATAKSEASTLRFGTHDIGVLNITGADYNLYKAVVSKDYNTGLSQVTISKQSSSSELQIEASAADLQKAIDEFKQVASGKIVLPADSPYKSATSALSEISEFSTYATHFVRNRNHSLQNKLTIIASHVEALAANAQVEVSVVALSISTKISTGVTTWVVCQIYHK